MDWSAWLADVLTPEGPLHVDLLAKLLAATVLGGVIGLERELSDKPAGLRTNILICVGAALLTHLSIHFVSAGDPAAATADPARIAAQIVSGIGFLGAGTIIQARGSVTGLTTAATLWVVAGIGMFAGSARYVEAAGSAVLVLVVLVALGRLEDRIESHRRARTVQIVLSEQPGLAEEVLDAFQDAGLTVRLETLVHEGEGRRSGVFDIRGSSSAYRKVRTALMEREGVLEIRRR